jgi:hypothetical protein
MVTYDEVVEKFCLCDVVAYIKARDGVVEYPPQLAGTPLDEAVKKFKGVPIKTEKDGKIHVFVVSHSAYLKKMLLPAQGLRVEVRTPSLSAPLP